MKLIRAEQVRELAPAVPTAGAGLALNWLQGPVNAQPLDVGLVTVASGASAPPHSHDGGQLIAVVSGRGWVETTAERISVGPGDLVITPPDEVHTHGADDDGPMVHLTVTAGAYRFPQS